MQIKKLLKTSSVYTLALAFLLGSAFALTACGKKAPPRPPHKQPKPAHEKPIDKEKVNPNIELRDTEY